MHKVFPHPSKGKTISLIPRPPPFFVLRFAFSIIHEAENSDKRGRPGLIHHMSGRGVNVVEGPIFKYVTNKLQK